MSGYRIGPDGTRWGRQDRDEPHYLSQLMQEEARFEAKLTQVTEDYAADAIDRTQFLSLTQGLRAQLADVKERIDSVQNSGVLTHLVLAANLVQQLDLPSETSIADVADMLEDMTGQNPLNSWDDEPLTWRAQMLQSVISKVVVKRSKPAKFHPERLAIEWKT